jgi:hypothetical protein
VGECNNERREKSLGEVTPSQSAKQFAKMAVTMPEACEIVGNAGIISALTLLYAKPLGRALTSNRNVTKRGGNVG